MWGAALAAGAAVFSFIGSRGNSTGSLLLANLKALEAVADNVQALNRGLQALTVLVADMYGELGKKIDLLNLEEFQTLQNAALEAAVRERAAFEASKGVSPLAHFETMADFFNDARMFREAFVSASAKNEFAGALIACYSYRLELAVLQYLIVLGPKVGKRKYGAGHLTDLHLSYRAFLSSALNEGIEDSIAYALSEDKRALADLTRDFSFPGKDRLPWDDGRYSAGNTALKTYWQPPEYIDTIPPTYEGFYGLVYSWQSHFVIVTSENLGSDRTPLRSITYTHDTGGFYDKIGKPEIPTKGAEYESRYADQSKSVDLPGFGEDKVFTDLIAALHRYNEDFSPSYLSISTRIARWEAISEACRITLSDIDCGLQISTKMDATCLLAE